MAVFTAAALAIAAAVATTTAATVATAVVATSIAIGVAGLAVTAVGMVTKNQDLLKAGKIMGYVGMAGGLAGGAIGGFGALASGAEGGFIAGAGDAFAGASQFLKEGWNTGVGSLFSGGEQVAGAVPGATGSAVEGAGAVTPPANVAGGAPLDISGGVQEELGRQAVQGTQGNLVASQVNAGITPGVSPTVPVVAAPQAPVTPFAQQLTGDLSQVGMTGQNAVLAPGATFTAPTPTPTGLAAMPEWAKYAGMTTAGQGVSGLASGYFAGQSAEETLKQQQLVNQQQQNQLQLLNKQGSYAPLIQFNRPAGA